MEKKKVLMIIPSLDNGGAERVVSNLALELSKEFVVDVLLDYNKVSYPFNGKIISVDSNDSIGNSFFKELYICVKKIYMLRMMKKNQAYDFYISHSNISCMVNLLTGTKNCKTILTLHCKQKGVQWSRIDKINKAFMKLFYNKASAVVAVSNGVRLEAINEFRLSPQKTHAIWNGSDLSVIRDKSKAMISSSIIRNIQGMYVFVTMGRLEYQKNQEELLEAFSIVHKKRQQTILLVLGEGSRRQILEEKVKELNLENSVLFLGFQENPFSYISLADCFVFTSLYEGFGYAIEEAMACGKVCISSDYCYGAREIFGVNEDGEKLREVLYTSYGVISPLINRDGDATLDVVRFAEAMEYVMDNPEYCKLVKNNIRNRVEEFSLSKMGQKWADLLNAI